ncbi:flagellar motor switch protein FliN [Trichloromonas sp.]|uniref:flagellar motor switch protein FliN n=1 Tax=Trichloromonas sp. TaxID=3069249 RepID=UPI002A3C084A|nr:flagellar motor switch protein FliN [Trichloromonas sp.]
MDNGKQAQGQGEVKNLEFLLDIPLQISVEVGRSRILIKELLEMQEGTVIELDKLAGEPLDVYVNARLIARGEAVLVNEKFGIRLTDVVSPAERIENLG